MDQPATQPLRARALGSGRHLPSLRATVGGLLVAAAMITSFAVSNRRAAPPWVPVVVSGTELAPGQPLAPDLLRVEHLDLPASVADHTFRSVEQLDGAVSLAPLGVGELVQSTAVLTAGDPARGPSTDRASHEYSFSVEAHRALSGNLRPGEEVDVVATMGTGDGAYTAVVAQGAVVVDVATGGSGLAGATTTLTLGLTSTQDVLELAHARESGEISVVRATRASREGPAPLPYRPRPPR